MTKKIYLAIIPIVAVIIFFIFYFQSNELSTQDTSQSGILQGKVSFIGLACPGDQQNSPPCSGPYTNYEIIVYGEDAKSLAKKVMTDDNGNYKTELVPGNYVIYVPVFQFGAIEEIPNQITIESSKSFQFDISIDSGIR